MSGPIYPHDPAEIVATVAEVFQHQNRLALAELLESAQSRVEYSHSDNWDGGIDLWRLILEVSVPRFAAIQAKLGPTEATILAAVGSIDRHNTRDRIDSVTIAPLVSSSRARSIEPESSILRIWSKGRVRLFLSHRSDYKVAVATVKKALWIRGVTAFVAHEDIEPSREWQGEIESALRSMHALAMFVTPDFHESKWTDQEVGWALGRRVPVLPIRLGADPYGLAGKVQAIPARLKEPNKLAHALAGVLLANPSTRSEMRLALLNALEEGGPKEQGVASAQLLASIADFSMEEKDRIWRACEGIAAEARSILFARIGKPPPQAATVADEIPF